MVQSCQVSTVSVSIDKKLCATSKKYQNFPNFNEEVVNYTEDSACPYNNHVVDRLLSAECMDIIR